MATTTSTAARPSFLIRVMTNSLLSSPSTTGSATTTPPTAKPAEAAAESTTTSEAAAPEATAPEATAEPTRPAERADAAAPAAPGAATPSARSPATTKQARNRVDDNEQDEERHEDAAARPRSRRGRALRCRHTLQRDIATLRDPSDDSCHTSDETCAVVPFPEFRCDRLPDRLAGVAVGDELFELVAGSNLDLAIFDGDEHQQTVIASTLPDAAPVVLEHLHGVLADVPVRREGVDDGDDDHVPRRLLKRADHVVHLLLARRIDDAGEIVHRLRELRRRRLREREATERVQQQGDTENTQHVRGHCDTADTWQIASKSCAHVSSGRTLKWCASELASPAIHGPGESLDCSEVFGKETGGINAGGAGFLFEGQNVGHHMPGQACCSSPLMSGVCTVIRIDAVEPCDVP